MRLMMSVLGARALRPNPATSFFSLVNHFNLVPLLRLESLGEHRFRLRADLPRALVPRTVAPVHCRTDRHVSISHEFEGNIDNLKTPEYSAMYIWLVSVIRSNVYPRCLFPGCDVEAASTWIKSHNLNAYALFSIWMKLYCIYRRLEPLPCSIPGVYRMRASIRIPRILLKMHQKRITQGELVLLHREGIGSDRDMAALGALEGLALEVLASLKDVSMFQHVVLTSQLKERVKSLYPDLDVSFETLRDKLFALVNDPSLSASVAIEEIRVPQNDFLSKRVSIVLPEHLFVKRHLTAHLVHESSLSTIPSKSAWEAAASLKRRAMSDRVALFESTIPGNLAHESAILYLTILKVFACFSSSGIKHQSMDLEKTTRSLANLNQEQDVWSWFQSFHPSLHPLLGIEEKVQVYKSFCSVQISCQVPPISIKKQTLQPTLIKSFAAHTNRDQCLELARLGFVFKMLKHSQTADSP